ncbi:MAG: DUF2779 domain-containing protein [Acidobacteria bacterium]|nr:DUF2779 domain-containing protein [Acidobacteriota bacterium]
MSCLLTKADWMAAKECAALAWFDLHGQAAAPETERFRMKQGQEIGVLARRLFPDAEFERAFTSGAWTARADIFLPSASGGHIIEVKSRFADAGNLEESIDDIAYTVMVAQGAGQFVTRASLLMLSRAYRFGDPVRALFQSVDVTSEALERAAGNAERAQVLAAALLSETKPAAVLVSPCRTCVHFSMQCLGKGIEHTVFDLPGLSATKLKRLSNAGIVDIRELPVDFALNPKQERARYSATSGNTVFEPGLAQHLLRLEWPCHYLDFETVSTALPLYEGRACHEQVLTQFSIHHRDMPGGELRHSEYLADPARDCEHELAGRLIAALTDPGSILVYSPFEQTRIRALAARFPDLSEPLNAILNRLVDLHPIIANNFYHPAFRGSFSIKKVLPALVPDLSYDDLAIAGGETAVMKFAQLALGEIAGTAADQTRRDLLEYCKLDTLAMVRLHDVLASRSVARAVRG